jgi:hypothetical protein
VRVLKERAAGFVADEISAIIEFTDTNAQVYPYRFYRAVSIQP